MSDLEVISLSLTAKYLGIDSKNDLFLKLTSSLAFKIERIVDNRTNRGFAALPRCYYHETYRIVQ